ncbi:hypothetical protein ACJX0J_028595, partial [Zea mays]
MSETLVGIDVKDALSNFIKLCDMHAHRYYNIAYAESFNTQTMKILRYIQLNILLFRNVVVEAKNDNEAYDHVVLYKYENTNFLKLTTTLFQIHQERKHQIVFYSRLFLFSLVYDVLRYIFHAYKFVTIINETLVWITSVRRDGDIDEAINTN